MISVPPFRLSSLAGLEAPISRQSADSLVHWLSLIWPSTHGQYDEFIRRGLFDDATYYALFYLCLFIFFPYFAQKLLREFIANSRKLKIGPAFAGLTPAYLPLASLVMFTDVVKARPFIPYDFFIDPFGFYYIRQWLLFMVIAGTLFFIGPLLAKGIEKISGKGRRNPSAGTGKAKQALPVGRWEGRRVSRAEQ